MIRPAPIAAEEKGELGNTGVMEFGVLGPVTLAQHGEAKVIGGLQRTLLAVLLSRPNMSVSHDVLTDALWRRSDDRSEANLHLTVHRLRRKLPEPGRLVSEPGGYRLTVKPGELDVERFDCLLTEGTDLAATDSSRAAQRFRDALRLWRGPAYDGVDLPLLRAETNRLQERRLAAVEGRCAAEVADGRYREVVPILTEAVAQYPMNERLNALLMVALYESGRQGHALAVYQSVRCVLIEELGQEPGRELRELERRVLLGESLDFGADPSAAPLPAQLPGNVGGFTGRAAQLEVLDELLEVPVATAEPPSIGVIVGTGGVGKTALAVHWSHRVHECFPDGQFYVDLLGFGPGPPISPRAALGGFLREFGLDGTTIPTEEAERAARFRTLVNGRRMLIVLDNAANAEQVRPLLPGCSSCLVLVTSRDSLAGLVARDGARRILLDRLSRLESLALLDVLVGPRARAEPDASGDLVERCARLPLALRIAAEMVMTGPGRIRDLVVELTEQESTLDVLDAGGDRSTALRAVFSWSYQRLGTESARSFRLLGLDSGNDIGLDAAASLFGISTAETYSALRTLRRAHLLDESTGRYRMHDLLRAYAADQCRTIDSAPDQEAALDRLVRHYVTRAEAQPSADWFDAERTNLVRIAGRAATSGRLTAPAAIASSLRDYLRRSGYHDVALPLYETALDVALQQNDLAQEAVARRYLGSTYRRTGRLHEAHSQMLRAFRCFERTGAEREATLQLTSLGVTCTWQGRYDEAIGHLTRALELDRSLGESGPLREGVKAYLGQTYFYRGEHEVALTHITEAVVQAEQLDHPVQTGAVATLAGLACERLGRYDDSCYHFERARSIVLDQRENLLLSYTSPLAIVYWHLDRRSEAYDHAHHCLSITQRTYDCTIEPEARITLGELYRLDGSYASALDQFRSAYTVAESVETPHQRARAALGIGDTLALLGEYTDAREHWMLASEVWSAIGSADAKRSEVRLRNSKQ